MRKLFYNGEILTMESPYPAEAVLTEGERILAVGDLSAVAALAGRHTETIDLCGGALLPGFVDCGGDFLSAVQVILSRTNAVGGRAMRAAVRAAAAQYAARGITVACGRGMTAETARARGLLTVAMTGESGGRLARICNISIRVPENETYKIQELHLPVYHAICAQVEEILFGGTEQ